MIDHQNRDLNAVADAAESLSIFKEKLKTYLFNLAYK